MVTFIDERKKMRIPQRVKPKHTEEPKQKKSELSKVPQASTPDYHVMKGCRNSLQTACMASDI